MSESGGPEELGMDAALEVLEAPRSELEARLLAGDEATAALRRQQLEALTSLAWALPAAPVSVEARQQLLGRLQGDETVRVDRPRLEGGTAAAAALGSPGPGPLGVLDPPAPPAWASAPAPDGGPSVEAASTVFPDSTSSGTASSGTASPGTPRGPVTPVAGKARRPGPAVLPMRAARSYRWALPLAAVFALAAIGVGLHDRRLAEELDDTRRALGTARREKQQLVVQLRSRQEVEPQAAALQGQMRELDTQLKLVTSTGTVVCRLRPAPGAPARDAGGLLYVAADHQHWYVRTQNLPDPGAGRVYQLWFLVGEKPIRAGNLQLTGDGAVLSSPTMPQGTSAALVTVERDDAVEERPSGAVVLFGRNMTPLL